MQQCEHRTDVNLILWKWFLELCSHGENCRNLNTQKKKWYCASCLDSWVLHKAEIWASWFLDNPYYLVQNNGSTKQQRGKKISLLQQLMFFFFMLSFWISQYAADNGSLSLTRVWKLAHCSNSLDLFLSCYVFVFYGIVLTHPFHVFPFHAPF